MRLVVFGLTVSSSWGNGHATLWRALASALGRAGHHVAFFERDQPWYAAHRDATALDGGALVLYREAAEIRPRAEAALREADVAMVTSYCPDAAEATRWVLGARATKVFYDMDTGVTVERARAGLPVDWIGPDGLAGFDLVLSFTGGHALEELRRLGARRVAPLYGSADPAVHHPAPALPPFAGDLSYLGTYAASRQPALEALFLAPAARLPRRTFVLAGSMYGGDFPWRDNVRYVRHLAPALHPAFFCSSPLTLSVTRAEMAALGACPSGRLFEAAACGVPVLSDWFEGLPQFFTPGEEILVARGTDDAVAAIETPRGELARIGARARERTLAEHTADARARELVALCEEAGRPTSTSTRAPAHPERGEERSRGAVFTPGGTT